MTIIEPQKNKQRVNSFFVSSVSLSLIAVIWSVFAYNLTVNLGRAGREVELKYKETLTLNAELKNKLYGLLDAKNLREVAKIEGLKIVVSPEYLEVKAISALAER